MGGNDPRRDADVHDWTPAEFGARGFDDLPERVRAFQAERFLPETGQVDRRTLKALRSWRQGTEDGNFVHGRHEVALRRLGSVDRYEPDDPVVVRSAPFTGFLLDGRTPRGQLDRLAELRGGPGTLLLDERARAPEGWRALLLRSVELSRPWREARALADASEGVQGLVLALSAGSWERIEEGEGRPLLDFFDGLRARTDVPVALCGRRSAFLGGGWARRRSPGAVHWRHLGEKADAVLPVMPHPYYRVHAASPERNLGVTSAECSIYWQARPSFQTPVFVGEREASRPDWLVRARAWLQDRGYRGYGWIGPLDPSLEEALAGELPAEIDRIDW